MARFDRRLAKLVRAIRECAVESLMKPSRLGQRDLGNRNRHRVMKPAKASIVLIALLWAVVGCSAPDSGTALPAGDGRLLVPNRLALNSASGIPVVLVEGGEFPMGSGVDDEGPIHTVTVSSFVIDQFEVRQSELAELQIPDASHFKAADRPVEMIRWSEAALVCNARSLAEGLEPCYDELTFACDFDASGYRLPTEAEWEYAARAGDTGAFPPGRPVPQLSREACYSANANGETMVTGSRSANALGLHDMLGNVAEWCNDVYAEDTYATGGPTNPRGPEAGPYRVLRGGSWKLDAEDLRVTARFRDEPGIDDACFAQDSYGFRMVRRPSDEELEQLSASHSQP